MATRVIIKVLYVRSFKIFPQSIIGIFLSSRMTRYHSGTLGHVDLIKFGDISEI